MNRYSTSRHLPAVAREAAQSPARRRARRILATAVAGVTLAGLLGAGAALAEQENQRRSGERNQPRQNDQEQPNRPHAGMLKFPDISHDSIVFSYANDLWVVPKEGGVARPLASPPGLESFPKFSPDGSKIAFVGNYEGDRDIYVIDAFGGAAERITYHPANENLNGWVGEDKVLFSAGGMSNKPAARQTQQLFVQTLDGSGETGGLPEQLPIPWGQSADISEDGKTLVYIPHSTDFRTWKRYRGGMATDIWLVNMEDMSAQQITDWEGTDTAPMLHDGKVYYLSDNTESARLNLFRYDPETQERTQLTDFDDFDVRFPSIGPGSNGEGEIVFQQGTRRYTLSLAEGSGPRAVDVIVPGGKPTLRPRIVEANDFLQGGDLGPTGKEAAFEARGDIWRLPAATGHPIHVTTSDDAADRNPSWSPDGRWLAYSSDAEGEYNIYLVRADQPDAEPKRVSDLTGRFWTNFEWAPDAKKFIAQDQTGRLTLVTVGEGDDPAVEVEEIDRDPTGSNVPISWSHDSNWIAYHRGDDKAYTTAVYLYDLSAGQKHKVTSDMFNAQFPTFDRKGEWLYFVTQIDFTGPQYSSADSSFVYTNLDRLVAVPLRKDVKNPMLPELDREAVRAGDGAESQTRPSRENGPRRGPGRRGGGEGGPGGGGQPGADMQLSTDLDEAQIQTPERRRPRARTGFTPGKLSPPLLPPEHHEDLTLAAGRGSPEHPHG